jgi:tetratricopeptide (TPR) repeat protein
MLAGERQVLSKYELSFIKEALFRRNVPASRNWIDLASIAFRLDRWEEGLYYLEQTDEPSASCDFYKGLYLLKAGRFDEAGKWFCSVMDKDANNAAAINNYAGCLWMLGKKEEAARLFKELTRRWPAYMDAARNLQLAMSENEDPSAVKFTWRELRGVLTVYEK